MIFNHWRTKKEAVYLAWWTVGVFLFGVGTATESLISLFGWNESVFRTWYISGALLGGAPLAQGTAYLLLSRKRAHILSVALVTVVLVASVCVVLTPIDHSLVEQFKPTGKVMEWRWVRWFSPFINTYSLFFLVGGAAWSAWQYRKRGGARERYVGNLLIAIGALLPGIGGSFTRFGLTEVLYVTEFLGLSLIYAGYKTMRSHAAASIHASQHAAVEIPAPTLNN